MRKPLLIANWKMYIDSPQEAKSFVASLKRTLKKNSGVEVWIAPPAVFVSELGKAAKGSGIKVGVQTVSAYEEGARTGELAAAAARAAGAQFAIVGHSERRAMGEGSEQAQKSLANAARTGLAPVLCVGERAREDDGSHFAFIEEQLRSALKGAQSLASRLVVAYEPVWAIGKTAQDALTPQELEEMVIFIRKVLAEILGRKDALKIKILYGGSVEGANTARLLHEGGVSGFLVGHASAKFDEFKEIIDACQV